MSNNNSTTNSRWTRSEELSLIKDISSGLNLDLLSQKHNRSVSAIELRLKKIIYENAQEGKSLNTISQLLHLNIEKVTQYYYSYKEFKEKHNPVVENQTVPPIQQLQFIQQQEKTIQPVQPTPNINPVNVSANVARLNIDRAFNEPSANDKLESKLKKLEIENRILGLIVENKKLTQQLNELIKEGKVDPSIKTIIKSLRKN